MSETTFAFFAACAPGLESLLFQELSGLRFAVRLTPGGAEGRATLSELRRLLTQTRITESVRVRLKAFRATDFATLERELARLPWHAYLSPEAKVDVSVTCHKSRLYHSDAVAERVLRAIENSLKRSRSGAKKAPTPSPSDASQDAEFTTRVFARVEDDVVQVSVDASGERLHRRGYRTHVVEAPLRETLAAALARLGIANGALKQLWDPFCGSGTIAAEWLATLLNTSPERQSYALDHWPLAKHQQTSTPATNAAFTSETDTATVKDNSVTEGAQLTAASALDEALSHSSEASTAEQGGSPRAWLSDKDPRAIDAARHNLTQTEMQSRCSFQVGDFESIAGSIPSGTAIITNPPYGVRLTSNNEAIALFQRFTALLQQRADLRPAIVLAPESFTASTVGGHWAPIARFPNGGVTVLVLRLR